MNSALFHLIKAQFKEFVREPSVLFWGFIFPILVAGVLGLAFMEQPAVTKTIAVVDQERLSSSVKRQFDSLERLGNYHFVYLTEEEALLRVKRGLISSYIEGYEGGEMRFHFDPSNSEARMSYLELENALVSGDKPFEVAHITAKGNRYIDFLIPGLIAMGIMNSCLWGIGWNLIDYRIKKLMRRMVATPMSRSTFLFAQVISRGILLLVEASIIYFFAHFAFGVEVQGSFATLFLILLAGLTAFSGLAIVIASRAKHAQVGNGLINAATMPMIILSGIFFSYQNFPDWAVALVQYLPLTMLADALRAVFNEGAGLQESLFELAALSGLGVAFFAFGLRVFKWY